MAQRSGAVASCAYGSYIHYKSQTRINTCRPFSGWPEVIGMPDKKSSTIKQILRAKFFRNGIPKTLVSDNTPEFMVGKNKV